MTIHTQTALLADNHTFFRGIFLIENITRPLFQQKPTSDKVLSNDLLIKITKQKTQLKTFNRTPYKNQRKIIIEPIHRQS